MIRREYLENIANVIMSPVIDISAWFVLAEVYANAVFADAIKVGPSPIVRVAQITARACLQTA